MNSLLDLNFTPIQDFSITIGKIEAGWMEITLSNPNRTFTYEASYRQTRLMIYWILCLP